jgi:23S rRNA (pseudouridine1915-N3)-methyltransferase
VEIKLIWIGKTEEKYLETGIEIYLKRIKHYINFQIVTVHELKNTKSLSIEQIKQKEGELLLKMIRQSDKLVLLDENGQIESSISFSVFIEKMMLTGIKNLIFVIGGAYGFSLEVYQRANAKISLSKMTFSHQLVRLVFVEQIYRAFTILKGEPYHHI